MALKLERRLVQQGFAPGMIHLLRSKGRILQKARSLDGDWESAEIEALNLDELEEWAIRTLVRWGHRPDRLPSAPAPGGFVSTPAALGYVIASDPGVRQRVLAIRQEFWQADEPPFPFDRLGQRTALSRASAWLDQTGAEDEQRIDGPGHTHLKFSLVFEYDSGDGEIPDAFRQVVRTGSRLGPDGLEYGQETPVAQVLEKLAEAVAGRDLKITHRSIASCDQDGEDRPLLSLRGPDGWLKRWPPKFQGVLSALHQAVAALIDDLLQWTDSAALEYLMTGFVPPIGGTASLGGLPNEVVSLTLSFPGACTERDVVEAYRRAMKTWGLKARKLSEKQLALLQIVHALPHATWSQRLAQYEEIRRLHPRARLPAYSGPTAQQAMRTDYSRAIQRAYWQVDRPAPAKEPERPVTASDKPA